MGALAIGSYNLTLDDFKLPSLNASLEHSSPFKICLGFHSSADHFERCFGELFVIDY
mgnify:CR=1 FL=1